MSHPVHMPWSRTWTVAACLWAILLCIVPDPRPLATPEWTIALVASGLHVPEPAARVIAAIATRMVLLGILGMLVMRASQASRFRTRAFAALLLAPAVGVLTLWVVHGHFPIDAQLKLAVLATLSGALATLLLRRNWSAGILLLVLLGVSVGLLTNYDMSDALAGSTRVHVDRLLAEASDAPQGDDRFLRLTRTAFGLAAQRTVHGDPILENQAAILALALVLGDEKLAKVADRYVDPARIPQCNAIRARTTLHDRPDWSRHFWVSAGLVVLSGESRSMNVGIIKEMKDANAGGSGFSFGDLTADAAGDRFAQAATRDVPAAIAMQQRMHQGIQRTTDLMPDPQGLPEGTYADDFEQVYGGVGGAATDSLLRIIRTRLEACPLLR